MHRAPVLDVKRKHLLLTVMALLAARDAYGDNPCPDPGCHIKSESTLTTQKGSVLALPPGYFLDEGTFAKRDEELKLAQTLNTRLKAENESLRKSAKDSTSPWVPIIGGIVTTAGSLFLLYLK